MSERSANARPLPVIETHLGLRDAGKQASRPPGYSPRCRSRKASARVRFGSHRTACRREIPSDVFTLPSASKRCNAAASEEHEHLRDLVPLPRGPARRLHACAAPTGDVSVAARALLHWAGGALDTQAPPLALPTALRRPPVTDHVRRLPARPSRATRPVVNTSHENSSSSPGPRVGPDDRAVALPARDQHADRARAVRRDRRLAASSTRTRSPATSGWCRPSTAPARLAGWARSPRPAPRTRAGCWSKRLGTPANAGGRRHAGRQPARPGPRAHRPRVARS